MISSSVQHSTASQLSALNSMTIEYRAYRPPAASDDPTQKSEEKDLTAIQNLIDQVLQEPYGIYVYRYFIYQWPHLCFLALEDGNVIGVIVCKLDPHRAVRMRGYIAMIAVVTRLRGKGIASQLLSLAVSKMIELKADEIVLETRTDNEAALRLYERLGFVRSKRMHRYYLDSSDAYRLILPLTEESTIRSCVLASEGASAPNEQDNGMYV
ncbi:acyl-CoA N-acyltransferase, partial [Myxozyma melibiosi]